MRFNNFREFFPYYLSQHRQRETRFYHFVGTLIGLFFMVLFLGSLAFKFIFFALLAFYGPAFASHYVYEQNKPTTFKYPFYSIAGDFKMCFMILTGKIKL